jgi:hypothetical protein
MTLHSDRIFASLFFIIPASSNKIVVIHRCENKSLRSFTYSPVLTKLHKFVFAILLFEFLCKDLNTCTTDL